MYVGVNVGIGHGTANETMKENRFWGRKGGIIEHMCHENRKWSTRVWRVQKATKERGSTTLCTHRTFHMHLIDKNQDVDRNVLEVSGYNLFLSLFSFQMLHKHSLGLECPFTTTTEKKPLVSWLRKQKSIIPQSWKPGSQNRGIYRASRSGGSQQKAVHTSPLLVLSVISAISQMTKVPF